uniref:Transposase Tc1-like domain-containing protein n=1 Tax=Sphaeramia orbicularis TaxID=375764 RepID=A0A673BCG8_9TELE
ILQAGQSSRAVARAFDVNHSTISRLQRKFGNYGTTDDRPRTGRPRVTTAKQDRYIRLLHLRSRSRPATATAAETIGTHHRPVHARTVRNRLRAEGIGPHRPVVGCVLTPLHREARLNWCIKHRGWIPLLGLHKNKVMMLVMK